MNVASCTQVRPTAVASTVRRKLSTPAASSAQPSWWRMRATAGCGWAGACATTTVTWDARLTSSTLSTRDVRRVDDALFESQTLCLLPPSRVLTTSSPISRHAMSALKVTVHWKLYSSLRLKPTCTYSQTAPLAASEGRIQVEVDRRVVSVRVADQAVFLNNIGYVSRVQ